MFDIFQESQIEKNGNHGSRQRSILTGIADDPWQ
jgi:hypothetical protein